MKNTIADGLDSLKRSKSFFDYNLDQFRDFADQISIAEETSIKKTSTHPNVPILSRALTDNSKSFPNHLNVVSNLE
jgi:hypothetical protein